MADRLNVRYDLSRLWKVEDGELPILLSDLETLAKVTIKHDELRLSFLSGRKVKVRQITPEPGPNVGRFANFKYVVKDYGNDERGHALQVGEETYFSHLMHHTD